MKALRVGRDFYVNADDIQIIQPWPSRPAARERRAAMEAGNYYDATGGKRILSVVTLRSGWVVATGLTPTRLIQRPLIAAPERDSFQREGSNGAPQGAPKARRSGVEVLEPSEEAEPEEAGPEEPREERGRAVDSLRRLWRRGG